MCVLGKVQLQSVVALRAMPNTRFCKSAPSARAKAVVVSSGLESNFLDTLIESIEKSSKLFDSVKVA